MNFIEGIIYMIWRGIAIGVIISAPMGPVGILCVQRTLEKGRRTGFFTGVGAAISDLFYCLLTGFGLSLIEDFLKANQNIIQIVGSVVLIVFGVYLFRSNPARTLKKPDAARTSRRKDVLQGFAFTVSNPLIIFLIIGLFARFNFLLPEISWVQYVIGYISIIGGALLWWWVVTFFVDKVRSHFNLRSMWLINRITGGIIMLFALVGIFTAVSGMADAATAQPLYLNSTRGFGPLASDSAVAGPLVIENVSAGPVRRDLCLQSSDEFSLSFRLSDLHCKQGKKWQFVDNAGSRVKIAYPGWGLSLRGEGHELRYSFSFSDNGYDDLYASKTSVSASIDGTPVAEADIAENYGSFSDWNSFRLRCENGEYILLGGNTALSKILQTSDLGFRPDSVGFLVPSGGAVALDYVTLALPDAPRTADSHPHSHFADKDVRQTYFARSRDKLEGVWEIFDRKFDDDRLRTGGNYRLAIVRCDGGYSLVYLAGAVRNAASWSPGALKARLVETGLRNVFDVQWYDPASRMIEGEIKAQFTVPDLLTLHFVDHDSELRLRKIEE